MSMGYAYKVLGLTNTLYDTFPNSKLSFVGSNRFYSGLAEKLSFPDKSSPLKPMQKPKERLNSKAIEIYGANIEFYSPLENLDQFDLFSSQKLKNS
mmetsp:Transcript_21781/g.19297  ORF Transcript_21781/g.19297 Transcript_21781/m.19297 type:complete len:96 (+) Transcript_21781:379-666(+)